MAKEIKQKIVLEGEKEYNQAIKEAQRNLRTLKSELKAETAELGKNATEQQKAEAKIKSLKKQIAEQEKIVKTYTEALQEVREKYADNQDEIAKWEVKLNNARTALANMKAGLEDVGQGFQNVKGNAEMGVVAAHSFAEAFGGLADIGDSISGTIEGIFGSIVDTMKAAIGEVWNMIAETAARANNWTDLADLYGASTEEIQKMQAAIQATQGDFSKFTTLMSQLSFGGKNKKIAEWFGVSDANYTNNLEYTKAVIDAMSEAYHEWGTGGRWDSAMTDIFGAKKSADVTWFVTNWEKITENAADLEGKNFLISEEDTKVLNDVYLKLGEIEEKWLKLKDKFAGGFGKVTLEIMTNVTGALDALAQYFNAESDEEREQALAEMEKNITEAFTKLGDAITVGFEALEKVAETLKESGNPIVRTIGSVLGGILEVFQWLTEDNANKLKTALWIIAGAWTSGKVLQMVSTIGELAGHIRTIHMSKGLDGVLKALGGGSAGAGAGAGAGAAGSGAATGVGTVTAGGSMLPLMLQSAGVAAVAIAPAVIAQAADEARVEEKRQARIDAAQNLDGTEQSFLMAAANALGLDWHGGNESVIEELLMGLGDRSDLQKSQLHNLLNGSFTSSGYETWSELQRLWGGEGMETSRMVAMLDAIADAYTKITETPADWWKNPGSSGSADAITGSDMQNFRGLPGQMQQAAKAGVAAGISGLRVTLDGRTVGALVAPYVSEYIGQQMDE